MRIVPLTLSIAVATLTCGCLYAASDSPRRPNGYRTDLPWFSQKFFTARGGGAVASPYEVAPLVLGSSSKAMRPNNIAGGPINFKYGSATNTTPTPGTGGDTTGGSTSTGSESTVSNTSTVSTGGEMPTQAAAAIPASARLYGHATVPQSLAVPVKTAALKAQEALSEAPVTARNYTLSLFSAPESSSQLHQAMKASEVLAGMSAPDVRKVFEMPTQVTDSQRAMFYRSRIETLAGSNAYRLSGEKTVVMVVKPRGTASALQSLRQKARSNVSLGARKADNVIASCLSGRENAPELKPLTDSMQKALGRDTSQLWLAGDASSNLAETLSMLKPATESVAGSDLEKLTVIAAAEKGLTPVRTGRGGEGYVRDGQKKLAQQESSGSLESATEKVVSEIHPNGLITGVSDVGEAERVLGAVQANPWYRDQASVAVVVEDQEGSELLMF